VKSNKKIINALIIFLILSLVIVQAGSNKTRFGETRKMTLPSYSVLDENAQPLISGSGKIGFVSSITDGSLISFSTTSGKILSSIVVGETVGQISMIEANGRRLIAVPAANLPAANHPATVTIIDATKAKQLQPVALLALPTDAQITPTTQAVISKDAKFCVIASSFEQPTLFSFNIETGEIVSQFPLLGRLSDMAFYDDGVTRTIAIASAVSNNVALVKLDEQGQLISGGDFSPAEARFEEVNNPAFSTDGRTLYIAAANGNKLFAVNAANGSLIQSLTMEAPQRITVAPFRGAFEMLGVTRIRRPINATRGGVSIIKHQSKELSVQAEFAPPDGIEFSRANNVVFNESASSAFVGSTTGVLFAFATETGELESYQVIGNEIRRLVLTDKGKKVAAVRSNASGDEVVLTAFDASSDENKDKDAPSIVALKPDLVEQGYANNLRISVQGENLAESDALLINGVEVATEFVKGGNGLQAQLPKSLFKQTGEISIQVKRADGVTSSPTALRVVKPQAPVIDSISPERVPSPASPFTLTVKGSNFKQSAAIFVNGQALNTQRRNATELQARLGKELARSAKQFAIEVKDLANPELISNAKTLNVVGPTIDEVKPFNEVVVAGDRSFKLRVTGENFREGIRLQINGETVPVSLTHRYNDSLIIANVPGRFAQEAKDLAVVVRNQSGDESNAVKIDARAPQIQAFAPEQVIAGVKGARVDIRGENFRRRASVYVGDGKGFAIKVNSRRVHFISSKQIIVSFTGVLKNLLAKPGIVQIQVVNPNDADGVSSQTQLLKVSAPEIAEASVNPIEGDETNSRLLINGANFRRGAVVEFIKAGEVVRQQAPVNIKGNRISIVVQAKKLLALGSFEVRVINPGDIQSNAANVRQEEIAVGNED
jgi:outer membrane protein assembly factor BamB